MENNHLDHAAQCGTTCPQEQEQTTVVETTVIETPQIIRTEILERVKALVDGPVEQVKDELENLKQQYYKVKRNEVEALFKAHIESGLPEAEFVPPFDEYEETLKALLVTFKERKAQYLQEEL